MSIRDSSSCDLAVGWERVSCQGLMTCSHTVVAATAALQVGAAECVRGRWRWDVFLSTSRDLELF